MGRVTEQANRTFTWDLASRLTAIAGSVNPGTITYDGLGAMTSSNTTGAAQSYVVNYTTALPSVAIVRGSGQADQRYYVYLPNGELLYSIEAADNARRFYHFDEMGNTVLLTNDAGELTDSYAITPYGEVVDHPGPTENPFTFQGKYGVMQEAAGLFSMRARHYDAVSARFLSPDKRVGSSPLETDPYVYANANPLMFNDPLGMWPWDGLVQAISDGVKAIVNAIQNPSKPPKPKVTPKPPAPPKLLPPPPPLVPLTPVKWVPLPPIVLLAPPTIVPLIGNDGGSLIGNDGGSLIGNDGGSLIGNDGGSLIGNDGGSLIGNDGGSARPPSLANMRPPNAYKSTPVKKAKNNKK